MHFSLHPPSPNNKKQMNMKDAHRGLFLKHFCSNQHPPCGGAAALKQRLGSATQPAAPVWYSPASQQQRPWGGRPIQPSHSSVSRSRSSNIHLPNCTTPRMNDTGGQKKTPAYGVSLMGGCHLWVGVLLPTN